MHLYNILLMLFDDKQNAQNRLDDFINKKPTVPAKPRRNELPRSKLRGIRKD